MSTTLAIAACLSFLAALALAWLGWVIWLRPASSRGARTASAMFALWWYALAVRSAIGGVRDLSVALDEPPLSLMVGLQFMNLVAVCMGLAGLLYYLLYLYTGRAVWFWPLTLGYAAYAGALVHANLRWEPIGVTVTAWDVSLDFANAAAPATTLGLLLILIGPQLVASLALFALSARLPTSASRVRLVVVSSAIFVWFASTFLASALGAREHEAWQVIELFIPLLVGLPVLAVHRPPAWLRRFLPPELPAPATPQPHPAAAARRL